MWMFEKTRLLFPLSNDDLSLNAIGLIIFGFIFYIIVCFLIPLYCPLLCTSFQTWNVEILFQPCKAVLHK